MPMDSIRNSCMFSSSSMLWTRQMKFEPTVPSVDCYFGTTLGPQEIVWLPGRLIQLTLLALCVQICTIQVKTFWKSLKKYITYENDILPVGILCHFVFLKTEIENNLES